MSQSRAFDGESDALDWLIIPNKKADDTCADRFHPIGRLQDLF